ncbi:MAG TPA: SRPBCC family protein [Sporichthya sp.]|nr:SRPBCC family protein [Sporichthya sp.]
MHTDYRRNVRVLAPVQLVWDEVSDLHAILSKSMQFLTYDLAADGGSARFRANLTWGPLKYAIEGTATVDEARPRELTRYVVRVPQLEMRYSGTIKLTPGSATETMLDYSGDLDIDHRLAGRMRGLFNELIEEHMHGLTARVKTRAEQRRLADERLLK